MLLTALEMQVLSTGQGEQLMPSPMHLHLELGVDSCLAEDHSRRCPGSWPCYDSWEGTPRE